MYTLTITVKTVCSLKSKIHLKTNKVSQLTVTSDWFILNLLWNPLLSFTIESALFWANLIYQFAAHVHRRVKYFYRKLDFQKKIYKHQDRFPGNRFPKYAFSKIKSLNCFLHVIHSTPLTSDCQDLGISISAVKIIKDYHKHKNYLS